LNSESKSESNSKSKSPRKRKRRDCEWASLMDGVGGGGSGYEFFGRYTGHCNLKTDIKEATFFGDFYICSGSDDGRCFIWDKETGKLVNVLTAVDQEVVNTVRRHPHFPILALSGIDNTIKIWAPSTTKNTEYTEQHPVPFTNPQSILNRKAVAVPQRKWQNGSERTKNRRERTAKIGNEVNDDQDDDDDDDWKESVDGDRDGDDEYGSEGMSEREMASVIEENQSNLSNPPSHRIDLSTLLFWANLMNQ